MKGPRLKKNPMLSMFLSAANAWAGAARGIATGTAKGILRLPSRSRSRRSAVGGVRRVKK
jgi:hypothetical protein